MTLRETLQKIVHDGNSLKLIKGNDIIEPDILLETLSDHVLERPVYMQTGLYIAEINESGYLGQVLFRFAQSS